MNPSTLIGLLSGLVLLALLLLFSAEHPLMFVDLPSLGIVVIGTFAATCLSYPLSEVRRVVGLFATVIRKEPVHAHDDIEQLVSMARLWLDDDLRAVEKELENTRNPFLRSGVQLVIDKTPEAEIIELLQWRIVRMRAKERAEAQLFRVMASYAPAFGMLGTLVGLVNLMFVLGDGNMVTIGHQMSVGLMTTLYGVLLANLALKPVAVKLERRTEQRVLLMNMVIQGISMMCNKRSPGLIRETLSTFVTHHPDEIREDLRITPRLGESGQP
ncbi:motility protein A [Pseudomonas sp. TE3610]